MEPAQREAGEAQQQELAWAEHPIIEHPGLQGFEDQQGFGGVAEGDLDPAVEEFMELHQQGGMRHGVQEEDEVLVMEEGELELGPEGELRVRPRPEGQVPDRALRQENQNTQGEVLDDREEERQEEEEGLIQFTDEEDEDLDLTAEQMASPGRDLQGIPWDRLQFSREHYRATRLRQYRNYVNVLPENPEEYRPDILSACQHTSGTSRFFSFAHNNRTVTTTIVHFQLRNLVWATSRNDVFVVSQNSVNHWNPTTRAITEVINLSGGGARCARVPDLGKVQVSTLCVKDDLVATGGFGGELVIKRLGHTGWVFTGRISHSENGITNGLEICDSLVHGPCVMAANNDCLIRMYEATEGFKCVAQWEFPWAVNFASMRPGGQLAAVVGDDPVTCLTDMRTGTVVTRLSAHADYSFAAAWHPDGNILATGNQDTTTAVWDIRKEDKPLVRLAGSMGAIRSLRWSPDGRLLAASEPADFVHIYDASTGYKDSQEIDLFGEISGMSFTPNGDTLYVGIADITYASLLAFSRARHGTRFSPSPAGMFAGQSMTAPA